MEKTSVCNKPEGEVTFNKKKIIKEMDREFYNSNEQPRAEVHVVIRNVPNITTKEIKRVLLGMKRGKTPGEAVISMDLIMDAGENATLELTNLFNKGLINDKTPKA